MQPTNDFMNSLASLYSLVICFQGHNFSFQILNPVEIQSSQMTVCHTIYAQRTRPTADRLIGVFDKSTQDRSLVPFCHGERGEHINTIAFPFPCGGRMVLIDLPCIDVS